VIVNVLIVAKIFYLLNGRQLTYLVEGRTQVFEAQTMLARP
jgi:hypothetical protein